MTRRLKILRAIRHHIELELCRFSELSSTQVDKRVKALDAINKRLPVMQTPTPKISSQRKLFY
jgi:hypothetical protein